MRDGFVKVGAATPDILVADCVHNREEIVKKVKEMAEAGTKVMAFPELCITDIPVQTCSGRNCFLCVQRKNFTNLKKS